ncbi:MAG TPA: Hsp33 family molecular chaperone HslO [Gammaproteobacteria bacterium]|nr:Hsp33 family molecular chaperone HslO [Gammaproteobacteria bacterium]
MPEHDSLRRFIFENLPVQGRHVHLDASWRAVLERQNYPLPVRALLGEAMAAMALLSATLKFDGVITLQVRGNGPLHLLVVQCTSRLNLRGLARWSGDLLPDSGLQKLLGDGRLAITIEPANGERYQGIVPLEGETLAACLEVYFQRSEQLPTRLWLTADDECSAGMLLQVMPERERNPDAWQHVTVLADTITGKELKLLSAQQLLQRLYHEEDIRLFEATPAAFRCQCSRVRIEATLHSLGADEMHSILREQGNVHVDCEFCGRGYEFDKVDVAALFSTPPPMPTSEARH